MCPICQNETTLNFLKLTKKKLEALNLYDKNYYDGALAQLFNAEEYDVAICDNCKHLFYEIPPNDYKLAKMYNAHANLRSSNSSNAFTHINIMEHKGKISLLRSLKNHFPNQATLLDYGAGQGVWSLIAAEVGFDVVAYEPYSKRVDNAIKHVAEWKGIEGKTFDIVLCNQVLEHVVNPLNTLKDIASISNEKTLLFSSVPNVGKYSLNYISRTWPYSGVDSHPIAPFQHLHGFSQKSFILAHKKAGYRLANKEMITTGRWGQKGLIANLLGSVNKKLSRTAFLFKLLN